jgi:serine/threonine protein kinase
VSPAARDAWVSADAFIVFGSNYVFVVASCVLAVILSDMVWTAQQQARSLGSYQLEERVGQGGMGEVWRATHRLLARQAAIKLVRPETLGGDAATRRKALARFEREAQATASLRSAHTIELYDFGVSEAGTFYYVMELLAGCDAAVLVERFGPTPAGRAVHLLRQVCDSLGEAHAAGLVHRDVKPSNVFVCRYGRAVDFVKVLDFGLVKPRVVTGTQLTADNVVSGTPAFMSPEQVVGKREVDARSDLYAAGCLGYWLLTARYVFEGANPVQIMMGHLKGTPEPPSRRAELPIPEKLDEILMACLEKDPANRPQTADELAAALAGVAGIEEWTLERAERWWERHCPDVGSESAGDARG